MSNEPRGSALGLDDTRNTHIFPKKRPRDAHRCRLSRL
jgi:hypothetical protein